MPNSIALGDAVACCFRFSRVPVSRARARSGVRAPSMVGDPAFERAVRVQANTLEWMPIFLPALWLDAIYVSDAGAAALEIVWIAGRVLYARDYLEAAESRARVHHTGRGGDRALERRYGRRRKGAVAGPMNGGRLDPNRRNGSLIGRRPAGMDMRAWRKIGGKRRWRPI